MQTKCQTRQNHQINKARNNPPLTNVQNNQTKQQHNKPINHQQNQNQATIKHNKTTISTECTAQTTKQRIKIAVKQPTKFINVRNPT